MIYDTGEYGIKLEVPTDNFVVHRFFTHHTEYMWDFMPIVKQSVPNESALIIFFGLFQNLEEYDHWFCPINEFYNSIPNPIVVFNGRLTGDDGRITQQPQFPYHRLSMFDHVSNVHWQEYVTNANYSTWANFPCDRPYKFYWASSKDLYPRRYLLARLMQHNLLKDNLINYKCVVSRIPSDFLIARFPEYSHQHIIETCDSIADKIPLPALDDTIEFYQTPRQFYLDSYVGIITDTFYDTGVFLSEKVFNAMHYYQLFVYLGPAYSLRHLKSLGYMTFGNIIDESYDEIEDNAERLFKFTESVIEFLKKPLSTIQLAYKSCTHMLEHNKNLLLKQQPDLEFTKLTNQALTK
jgi:hypothetical protein